MTKPTFLSSSHKTALVTGASRRVGAMIAKKLANAGYQVICHVRQRSSEMDRLVDGIIGEGGVRTKRLAQRAANDVSPEVLADAAADIAPDRREHRRDRRRRRRRRNQGQQPPEGLDGPRPQPGRGTLDAEPVAEQALREVGNGDIGQG